MVNSRKFIDFIPRNLFAPNDTIESKSLGIDDLMTELGADDIVTDESEKVIMDSLAEALDDNKSDDKKVKEEKKEAKADDKKDDKEKTEDLEEEKPEDLELINVPKRQEILKAYPDFFKKFPAVEKVMYREREYTEIFGSVDDAKEAHETVEDFNKFQGELLKGNIESVYKAVKEADPEAFKTIVDNLIPNLQKVDNDAYLHIVGDVTKRALMSTWSIGKNNSNEDLQKAALIVWKFIFGDAKAETTPFGKARSDDKSDSVEREREEFLNERFESARDDLTQRVSNVIRSSIVEYIDKKNEMTPYIKRNAVQDVLRITDELISNDTRFTKLRDGLWEKAREAKFSPESINKIKSAWLTVAKQLLPDVIRKVRVDALKNASVRDDDEKITRRNRDVVTKVDEPAKRESSDKNQIPKGVKTLDYLMQD